jgi:hypothetical protein
MAIDRTRLDSQLPNWEPVTPSYVASVLNRYPAQRPSLLELARSSDGYGPAFVRRVLQDDSFTEEDTQEIAPVPAPHVHERGTDA